MIPSDHRKSDIRTVSGTDSRRRPKRGGSSPTVPEVSPTLVARHRRPRREAFVAEPTDLWTKYAGIKRRSARALAFIQGELRVPSGRYAGRPYELLPFQRRILRQTLDAGALHAVWSLPRGAGKTGLIAALAVYFLYDRPGAHVVCASVGLRTARLSYDRAVRMIETSPRLAAQAQVYTNNAEPYVELPGRGSRLLPLPAQERMIVGFAASEAIIDEVGYVDADVLEAIATGMGKVDGSLLISVGTPGLSTEDATGQNPMYALRTLALSDAPPDGLVYIEHAARPTDDPRKPSTWKRANPALGILVDPRAVALDLATLPLARFAQMRLGLWVQHESAWMRAELWDGLTVVPGPPGLGELVGLGFDGSTSGDATALVAYAAGRLSVLGVWERPPGPAGDHWTVPRVDVIAQIDRAFSAYRVSALFADPWGWRSELQELSSRYGDRVVEFNTASYQRMGPATDAFMADALTGALSWDGHPRLRSHVISAAAKQTPSGDVLTKDARRPQQIDLAIAAILAHEAARLTPAPPVVAIY